MVTFYVGCVNHCVQKLLWDVGIPVQGKGKSQRTPLYKTGLTSIKVGSFCSSVVVAMHLIPRDLLQKAIDVTTNFKDIHGMPIHIGDPSVIGITDVNKPDYGDSPDIQDRVPVFWASSITAHLAVKSAGKFCFNILLFCLAYMHLLIKGFCKYLNKPSAKNQLKIYAALSVLVLYL